MVSSATPWRISGVGGLLFVVTSFVASAINVQPPPYTQDSATIAAWFAENSQQYRAGHFVAGLAFLRYPDCRGSRADDQGHTSGKIVVTIS